MKTCLSRGTHHSRHPAKSASRNSSAAPNATRRGLWALMTGLAAVFWFLLRTGTKPSRMSYPCQQSALAVALTSLSLPTGAALAIRWSRRPFLFRQASFLLAMIAAVGLLAVGVGSWGGSPLMPSAMLAPPADYTPEIFLVSSARGADAGRFGGVDDLVSLMGAYGFKWYRSPTSDRTADSDGMIDRDDVVLLKINAQWSKRGGTNTDVLRGVLRSIVEHPDGFVGEIIVADNGQGSGNLDRAENNADIVHQSPQDVVNDFVGEGWNVSTRLWDSFRTVQVDEYLAGDLRDGYVLDPTRDPQTQVRLSYPKFRSAAGTCISYKHGIWEPDAGVYNADRLVVINLPVLKTHSIYGVTAAVKNHMGVITQSLGTDSHAGVGRGGLGSVLADVRLPDLTLLDCIWILARPGSGPAASYEQASFHNGLMASVDPVALDAWAVKHILLPQIVANGYSPAHYGDTQDPDNANSVFRRYLDRSMNEMLLAGIPTTNDYAAVRVHQWSGDANADGLLDLGDHATLTQCLVAALDGEEEPCARYDFNADQAIDLSDVAGFQNLFGPH